MRSAMTLVSALVLVSCNITSGDRGEAAQSSGSGSQRSYEIAAADRVSLLGHHDLIINVGGAPSVRAEGDPRELDDLEVTTRGSELRIGLREGAERRQRSRVTVHVTLPALVATSLAGSGDIRIDRVQGPRFQASIGGSGDISIAELRVEEAQIAIAGSGDVSAATGQIGTSDINIAGSGNVDLGGIEGRTASVSIVGSGDVALRASETVSASVMGSGDVNVAGSARCEVRKMGSGSVRCQG